MTTYSELYPSSYYLIKEHEHASIELVYIPMVTDKCVLVEYQDEEQTMNWFKKTDPIYELIEQLTEEQAVIYESLFENDEEEDEEDWVEDDDPNSWFNLGSDDDADEDDRIRALNN